MTVALYIVFLLIFTLLLLVSSVQIRRTALSKFELNRRIGDGDVSSKAILHREMLLHDVMSLQRVLVALLLVALVVLAIAACGWLIGTVVSVVVAFEFGLLSRQAFVRHFSQRWYEAHEASLLRFIEQHPRLFAIIRGVAHEGVANQALHSREELLYLMHEADILTDKEKRQIVYGLDFAAQRVADHMTPVEKIITIGKKELLGPLVLNDLHETGYSRFPVIGQDINDIVGIVDLSEQLTIDAGKHSTTAEKSMTSHIAHINHDATLEQALAVYSEKRPGLVVVVDGKHETVGLISLSTILGVLLGRSAQVSTTTPQD